MENDMTTMTVKEYLISNLKISLKMAIIGLILFFTEGVGTVYILMEYLRLDTVISGIIGAIIFSITLMFIDHKRFHYHERILENNKKLFRQI